MKILIAGATGNIGSQILPLLLTEKTPVAAAVRNVKRAWEKLQIPGLEYRQLDFADPETWETALADVGRLFLVVPPGSATPGEVKSFFAAAKNAGVQHVVFSSGRTTGDLPNTPLNVVEQLVKKSGMDWTILRPGWFMQNFINWVGFTIPAEDAFYLPAADARTAFIDVRDIAAVAAKILSGPTGHHGKIYELTSGEALNHEEVAAQITKVARRPIRYVPLAENEFIEAMTKRGWSKKAAEKAVMLYGFVRSGKERVVSGDVEQVLGRQAIGFQQFTEDNAVAFMR